MNPTWRRSEPREFRPFFAATAAEKALEHAKIRLFERDAPSDRVTHAIEALDFHHLAVTLLPEIEIDTVVSATPELASLPLDFVAFARDPFHKRVQFLHRQPVDSPIPQAIPVDQNVIDSFAHGRAVQLTLALCLAEDANAPPGFPTVQGQWISQKAFEINLRTAPSLFDIRPIPDQEWKAMGFPARTFTLIERTRDLNEELAEDETVAIGYIHEDAYSAMANGPNSTMLQAIVAVDMLVDVILESREELEGVKAVQPGTPLDRLLARLSRGRGKLTIIELQRLLSDPRKLKALLQAELNVVSLIR
jgi:hypothetical protein